MEAHDEAYAHALLAWGRTIDVHRISEPEDWAEEVAQGNIDPSTGRRPARQEVAA